MHFRVFSEGQGTKWRIFLGLLRFQIFIWGAWGTLIFPCIRRLGLFLGVQNVEFQYFGVFQKTEYFWGYEDFVDIFSIHHKNSK